MGISNILVFTIFSNYPWPQQLTFSPGSRKGLASRYLGVCVPHHCVGLRRQTLGSEIDPSVGGKRLLLRQMVSKVFHSEHGMSFFVLFSFVIGMKSKGPRM